MLLAIIGPALAVGSVFLLSDEGRAATTDSLVRVVLLLDVCYILTLAALITWRIGGLFIARRRRSAGTHLHLRLAGVFAAVALVPTIIVAIFATLTLGFGLESLFSDRIGSVVRNSLTTAEAYEREHRTELRSDILNMASDLNRAAAQGINQAQLNDIMAKQSLVRELPRAYIFNLDREIVARGEFSYLFNFVPPSDDDLQAARRGEVVVIEAPEDDELRALVYLPNFFDAYLYISRHVQGDVLRLLDETRDTVQFYERLERERGSVLFNYGLLYLGLALFVILGAIMLGLWFAERLAKPVGRLAGAAELVGAGDLDIRVKEQAGNDEIAMLSRIFNRMTGQLKGQRDLLITARDDTERRRQFIEAVLSGVTAGVIGLDEAGCIDLMNDAAAEMLGTTVGESVGHPLATIAPGLETLHQIARDAPNAVARGEVRHDVRGESREFLARVAPKSAETLADGYVLTFDDMTALASAQRMAAWGDVARRIAHEIKNPLTPIQLSADRMRRKFVSKLGEDGATLEQYLDVITRQAGDIRRMVDEFSKFARMPEPVLQESDLGEILTGAVLLQKEARVDIDYQIDLPDAAIPFTGDRGLIHQVFTNLLQNAADAIDARIERDPGLALSRAIRVSLEEGVRNYRLAIIDSGVGLPVEDRDRLTDPYVTTRAKGTGLGLAIVKKIIEQHGGELQLGDAAEDSGLDGAQISIRLPKPAGRPAANSARVG